MMIFPIFYNTPHIMEKGVLSFGERTFWHLSLFLSGNEYLSGTTGQAARTISLRPEIVEQKSGIRDWVGW